MAVETVQIENDYYIDAGGVFRVSTVNAPMTFIAADSNSGIISLEGAKSVMATAGVAIFAMTASGKTGGKVEIQAGISGEITMITGIRSVGPRIAMTADEITLSVGPAGVGASLSIKATGITLQMGVNKFELTATGIGESVLGVTTRKAEAAGHTLKAAETQAVVGVAGVNLAGPINSLKSDATFSQSGALGSVSTTGPKSEKDGILVLG